MSNNKADATYHAPSKREAKRAARDARVRNLPLPAKIGAGVVTAVVFLGGFVACGAAVANGQRYEKCAQELAQEIGHDSAKIDLAAGACQ